MPDRLAGRTALVTGGGNGLGRAMATALAERDVRVVIAGRTASTLEDTSAALGAAGHDARVVLVDVSDPDSVAALGHAVADEEISILVNNAGVAGPVASLVDVEPDEWDDVFATNVRGTYLMCRELLPPMIERGTGDIVNVASVSGKRPLPRRRRAVRSSSAPRRTRGPRAPRSTRPPRPPS